MFFTWEITWAVVREWVGRLKVKLTKSSKTPRTCTDTQR